MLKIPGKSGASAFDVAITWDKNRAVSITRERDDLLKVRDADKTFTILLPARERSSQLRQIESFTTDAVMCVLDNSGAGFRFSEFVSLRDAGWRPPLVGRSAKCGR